jgi:hypothetical protein
MVITDKQLFFTKEIPQFRMDFQVKVFLETTN